MALLLTVREWVGPGRKIAAGSNEYLSCKVTERIVGVFSRVPLGKSLEHLRAYEEAYNERYRLAVNFFVLAISEVSNLSQEQVDLARFDDLNQMLESAAEMRAAPREK